MWSDTLMLAERSHVLRLFAWGAACALAGTLLLLAVTIRPRETRLLTVFAVQTAAWGLAEVLAAIVWWRSLAPRDISGAERLDDALWFLTGLESAVVIAGAGIVIAGWRSGRILTLLGAGTAVVVQGLALMLLSLGTITRMAALRIG